MSFYSSSWVKKTRKRHVCGWCGKFIEAGSAAERSSGITDDFWSMICHPECAAAQDALPYDELCDGWFPGDYARGRTDDDTTQPPEFSPDYRGRVAVTA